MRPGRLSPRRACPCFNPRTRTGCDWSRTEDLRLPKVSIHAPARGATLIKIIPSRRPSFNPRTRTGCDAKDVGRNHETGRFQSTHPHGVRLSDLAGAYAVQVSIHAPARGATITLPDELVIEAVSIHAPARGATKAARIRTRLRRSFNPRTRTGCDMSNRKCQKSRQLFQSTHPHGVRRRIAGFLHILQGVSIHAPARGATRVNALRVFNFEVSIHAPARGATGNFYEGIDNIFVSIHAPARGATQRLIDAYSKKIVSIHAPARGATREGIHGMVAENQFQSTHPHGVRPNRPNNCPDIAKFQSTHPHGVRPCAPRTSTNGIRFQSTHPHGVRLGSPKVGML